METWMGIAANERTNEQTNGRTDGWTDGRTERLSGQVGTVIERWVDQ